MAKKESPSGRQFRILIVIPGSVPLSHVLSILEDLSIVVTEAIPKGFNRQLFVTASGIEVKVPAAKVRESYRIMQQRADKLQRKLTKPELQNISRKILGFSMSSTRIFTPAHRQMKEHLHR